MSDTAHPSLVSDLHSPHPLSNMQRRTGAATATWQRLSCCVLSYCLLLQADCTLASDSPVADAVETKDDSRARELIDQGIDVNAAQADGMTALHWAVHFDNLEMVGDLLAARADVNAANRYGVPPLSLACQNGHARIVELLLDAGADPESRLRGGETPLMTAARTGRPAPVSALIDRGAGINAQDRRKQTAMMWAAAEGNVAVVDALLAAGADFQTPLTSGFTPFFFAIREGRTAVALRLLAAGIDVNEAMDPRRATGNGPQSGTSALLLAVENGHFELAAALLEAGADPNDRRAGYAALHAMTWVRKPLRGDGDPPPEGSGNVSSLQFVQELVSHGADVNLPHGKDKAGNGRLNKSEATAFLLAAETGDVPLMKLLLELGADPTLVNRDDVTPLLAAAGVGILGNGDESAGTEEDAISAVKLLLELGADINAVEKHGETAMHGAAYKSWTRLVQFLAENGADINVWNQKNQRGWTPLLIAQGHRPGNFRPSQETIVAIERVVRQSQSSPDAAID